MAVVVVVATMMMVAMMTALILVAVTWVRRYGSAVVGLLPN